MNKTKQRDNIVFLISSDIFCCFRLIVSDFWVLKSFEMDYMFDAYVGYDIGEVDDIPKNTLDDIWLLGKKYNFDELDLIRADVQTKLWCTYRRGFPGIGDLQLTSDKGFGCMLR